MCKYIDCFKFLQIRMMKKNQKTPLRMTNINGLTMVFLVSVEKTNLTKFVTKINSHLSKKYNF